MRPGAATRAEGHGPFVVVTSQAPAAAQKKGDFLLDTTWAGGGHRGSVASLPCPDTSTPAPAWAAGPNSRREAPEGNAAPFQAPLSVVLSSAGGNHSRTHAHRGHPVPERGRAGLRGAVVLRLWRGIRARCPTPTKGLPVSPPGPLSEAAPPPRPALLPALASCCTWHPLSPLPQSPATGGPQKGQGPSQPHPESQVRAPPSRAGFPPR